jgi:hypothetical protein
MGFCLSHCLPALFPEGVQYQYQGGQQEQVGQ